MWLSSEQNCGKVLFFFMWVNLVKLLIWKVDPNKTKCGSHDIICKHIACRLWNTNPKSRQNETMPHATEWIALGCFANCLVNPLSFSKAGHYINKMTWIRKFVTDRQSCTFCFRKLFQAYAKQLYAQNNTFFHIICYCCTVKHTTGRWKGFSYKICIQY